MAVQIPTFNSVDEVVSYLSHLYNTFATERSYAASTREEKSSKRGMDDLLSAREKNRVKGVTLMEHALQCAYLAKTHDSSDAELIVGALLHDCGWLLPKPDDVALLTSSGTRGEGSSSAADSARVWLAKHDVLGARFLRQLGFSDRCAMLVEGHVQAKRYLCYKEPAYLESLSDGSKFTLQHQGGVMTAQEAVAFEAERDFELYCLMRRWDEAAKVPEKQVPQWDSYLAVIRQVLQMSAWAKSVAPSSPLRPENLVTAEAKDRLFKSGFVVIKNWLSRSEAAMLVAIAEHIGQLQETPEGPFQTFEETQDGVRPSRTEKFADVVLDKAKAKAWNLQTDTMKDVLGESSRLEQICSSLMGKPCSLYKEKINYKYPNGSGGYKPHQDLYAKMPLNENIPLFQNTLANEDVCICMIALDKMTVENGCAQIAPGWHSKGVLHFYDGIRSEMPEETLRQMREEKAWMPVELEKGDVLVYGNHMPHFSEKNMSTRARRALFAIYADGRLDRQRQLYYERESQTRRKQGSKAIGGKANQFFTGQPVASLQRGRSSL